MSDFDQAIPVILKHEGGLADNPADPGGITNYGISLRYLHSLVQQDPSLLSIYDVDHQGEIDGVDIRDLPEQDAIQIYKMQWWDKNNYGLINDQALSTKIFDLAVNIGTITANKFLQRACNQVAGNVLLMIDGIIGLQSIAVINKLDPAAVLAGLRKLAKNYYENLAVEHPALQQFLNGWLNRLADA